MDNLGLKLTALCRPTNVIFHRFVDYEICLWCQTPKSFTPHWKKLALDCLDQINLGVLLDKFKTPHVAST